MCTRIRRSVGSFWANGQWSALEALWWCQAGNHHPLGTWARVLAVWRNRCEWCPPSCPSTNQWLATDSYCKCLNRSHCPGKALQEGEWSRLHWYPSSMRWEQCREMLWFWPNLSEGLTFVGSSRKIWSWKESRTHHAPSCLSIFADCPCLATLSTTRFFQTTLDSHCLWSFIAWYHSGPWVADLSSCQWT